MLFSSELAHASSVWTERSYIVASRAQHVRRCLLEVVLVPVSAYSLSLPLPSSVSVLSGAVRKDDLCKSAAKLPRASIKLCDCELVRACADV